MVEVQGALGVARGHREAVARDHRGVRHGEGVARNARTIKWCFSLFYILRAPLNGVLYNARTIKWCFI